MKSLEETLKKLERTLEWMRNEPIFNREKNERTDKTGQRPETPLSR